MISRKFLLLGCMLVISILPHTNLRAQASEIERLTEALTQQEGAEKLDTYSELSLLLTSARSFLDFLIYR